MFSPSFSFSLGSMCKDLAQGTVFYVSDKFKSAATASSSLTSKAATSTALYLYEKTKEKCPNAIEKVEKFSNSIVGKHVVSAARSTIGETVGMTVGSLFPSQMIAFSAGRRVAEYMVLDPQEEGVAKSKSKIAWTAGFGAVLTVTALSAAIAYLTSDPSSGTVAYGFLITSLGTVIGKVEGLHAIGAKSTMPENILDSDYVRTFQYLAAQGAIEVVRDAIPVPPPLMPLTGLVGSTLKAVAGTAGYYAKPLTRFAIHYYYQRPVAMKINYFDPGENLKRVIENSYGSTHHFNRKMAQYINFIPFAVRVAEEMLGRAIDHKVGTNVLVRTFNEYMNLIQDLKIQQGMRKLASCEDPKQRIILKQSLDKYIYKKMSIQFDVAEHILAFAFHVKTDQTVYGYVNWLVDRVQEKEIQMIGFQLSDPQKSKEMLKAHATNYLKLALVQLKRALSSNINFENLTDDELKCFYQNLNILLFSPYAETRIGRVTRDMVSIALPLVLNHGPLLSSLALGRMGQTITEDIVKIDQLQNTEDNENEQNTNDASSFLFVQFPFLLNVKKFFMSFWDTITSIFKEKNK